MFQTFNASEQRLKTQMGPNQNCVSCVLSCYCVPQTNMNTTSCVFRLYLETFLLVVTQRLRVFFSFLLSFSAKVKSQHTGSDMYYYACYTSFFPLLVCIQDTVY